MTATLPDGRPFPATRAELLVEQAEQVNRFEGRLYSIRRALRMSGWLLLTGFATVATLTLLGPGGWTAAKAGENAGVYGIIVGLLIWALVARSFARRAWWVRHGVAAPVALAIFLLVGLSMQDRSETVATAVYVVIYLAVVGVSFSRIVSHALAGRALRHQARRWKGVDRVPAAVDLAPGEFDDGQRPHRPWTEAYNMNLLKVTMLATVPGIFGLVLFLAAILDWDRAVEPVALRPVAALGGAVMLGSYLWLFARMGMDSFQRQHGSGGSNQGKLEAQLSRAQQAALTGQPAPEPPPHRLPWPARIGLVVLFVLLVVLLLTRVAAATPVVLVSVVVILALAALASVVPLARRHRLHVEPLLAEGPSFLQAPTKRVNLDADDTGVWIHPTDTDTDAEAVRIDLDDILAVTQVKLAYPFAPPAVAIITADLPTVLAGAGVLEDPAISTLRDHASTRRH